jgi:hypothetical protein
MLVYAGVAHVLISSNVYNLQFTKFVVLRYSTEFKLHLFAVLLNLIQHICIV